MRLKRTLAAVLALCLVLSLAACGASGNQSAPDASGGGPAAAPDASAPTTTAGSETPNREITIVQGSSVSSLDMHLATGTTTASICFNMYDSLTRADKNGVVQPLLAKEWTRLDDTTWQFKLQEGVKFHNGEEFNADTVIFSIERILDTDFASPLRGDFSRIASAEAVDEYTVNITTTDAFPSLPLRITYLAMEPKGYIEEVGNEKFAEAPVGTGPYKFVEHVAGSHVVLEKNDAYWNGVPEVEKLTFKIVPEESTRMLALETGEADIAIAVPPSQVERLLNKEGISAVSNAANRIIYIGLNQIPADSPLRDKRVRQALNYAVNQSEIIDTVLEGIASPVATLTLPQWYGYDANIEGYPYDLEQAKTLLAEAGYADGLTFDISVVPSAQPAFKEVAEAVAGQLKAAGVNATVITSETLAQRELLAAKTIQPLHITGLGGPYAENSQTLRIMLCEGERYSVTADPEFDAMFKAASALFEGPDAMTAWSNIQQRIKEEAYTIPLYQLHSIYGISDRLDWTPRLDEIVLGAEMSMK